MPPQKSKYRVLNPVGIGGRRERGEELVITDAEAAAVGRKYLQRIGPATPSPAPAKNLPGEKPESGDQAGAEGDESQSDSQTDGNGEGRTSSPADEYEGKSYRDLQELCKERELPANGSHEDLVARLRESDADGE